MSEAVEVAPLPGSPEWLAARRDGLGASEVPAILGLDPYKTALDIWLEKRGLAEGRVGDTMPQKVGRFAEGMIASLYAETTGQTLVTVPTRRHGELSMLFASADRMVVDPDEIAWRYPVEIKNRGGLPRGWGEAGTDEIPEAVAVQAHVQMACYGLDRADVAALLGGNDFRIYTLQRRPDIEAYILENVAAWWQRHIVEGVEPAIEGPSASKYLAQKFAQSTGEVVAASEEVNAMLASLARVKRAIAEGEAEEEALTNAIKAAIGEHKGVQGPAGKALWSPTKGRTTTDWKGIAAALNAPKDMIEQFTTTGPESRTFRFTPAKEV